MSSDSTDSEDWLNEFDSAGMALLTPQERAEVEWLMQEPLWRPLPGPQTAAMDTPADVTGFGGSAGGGCGKATCCMGGLQGRNAPRSPLGP